MNIFELLKRWFGNVLRLLGIFTKEDELGEHSYGRGKFVAHENYIKYMQMIVEHPNYGGMPNAVSSEGRILWQVSSGKTTSFYKDYLARRDWWIKKADSLKLPGKGDENDRFTIAARMIHPTGYRACRLCGKSMNVGYFYLNHALAGRLRKDFPSLTVSKYMAIDEVLAKFTKVASNAQIQAYLHKMFPERSIYFKEYGETKMAFERSCHVRTRWLSPGFMGNPPDRLDGFHDYDLNCRKLNDPGRHDANMRTYNHDRRTFEWWAEGNWAVADALYNSAGPGKCLAPKCSASLDKVSPDHIGPLSCGFKQMPLFLPTCPAHNSSKQRRFSHSDVMKLIQYEKATKESVASWQVRSHWDKYKKEVAPFDWTEFGRV